MRGFAVSLGFIVRFLHFLAKLGRQQGRGLQEQSIIFLAKRSYLALGQPQPGLFSIEQAHEEQLLGLVERPDCLRVIG